MFKIILTIGTIQSLAVFIQFIKSKFVAVYLGPAGAGIVGTIDQIVVLTAFASSFGLPAASIKFLSKSHGESDRAFIKTYEGFFKSLLLLSTIGAGLAIGAILLRPQMLGEELEGYKLLLILGLLTVPSYTLINFFVNVFAALQKSRAASLLVMIAGGLTTTAAVLGIWRAGILGFYIGSLLAGILTTAAAMIYLRHKFAIPFYNRESNIRQKIENNRSIFSTAPPLYFTAITALLAYLTARYSVLENFGEVEAGLLHGAMALSFAFGTAFYPAINIYLNPIVNRSIETRAKFEQVIQFQRKCALILSLAALPVMFFPKLMLTIFFSEKFAGVADVLYLFIISQFVVQLAGVFQALLVGLNDVKSYALITSGGQIISAGMCLVLVPRGGITGVALSFLMGNFFSFTVSLVWLISKHRFSLSTNAALLIGYVSFALFLAGWTSNQFNEWNAGGILAKIGFLFVFGGSLFLFLNQEEKKSLRNLRRKILLGSGR